MIYFMWIIFILFPIFLITFDYFFRFKGALLGHYLPASPNPKIFLTYDDGPHYKDSPWGHRFDEIETIEIEGYNKSSSITDNLLELFEKNDINAIFYVHGDSFSKHRQQYKSNIVGNHGFNHKNSLEISKDELISEMKKADQNIKDCATFRPPGGNWKHDLTKILWDNGLEYTLPVYWDYDTKDYQQKEISEDSFKLIDKQIQDIIQLVKRKKKNVVILQHDVWIYSYLFTKKLIQVCIAESISIGSAQGLISESKKITRLSQRSKFLYYLNLRFNQLRSCFYRII